MSKKAFIFPGQGSQYVGMAKDIYEKSTKAKEFIREAEERIKFKISKVMFEGPVEELKLTSVTQPAIFIHSLLLLNEMKYYTVDAVAGHSLGEYTSLVANKCLKPLDALALVRKRGEAMLSAGQKYSGTMAAIVGINSETLEEICKNASADGIVQCANFNSPGQIVISGSVKGVNKAMLLAKEGGAKIVKELVVSGAFHSPLMEPAIEELKISLDNTEFTSPQFPVYANVNANPISDIHEIKDLLLKQLTAPVKWELIIDNMIKDGITQFVEVGPGKVLQGLGKRINKEVEFSGIDKYEDLENFL
jgi:[acyl-carrier-protein] S-malonyltransferase